MTSLSSRVDNTNVGSSFSLSTMATASSSASSKAQLSVSCKELGRMLGFHVFQRDFIINFHAFSDLLLRISFDMSLLCFYISLITFFMHFLFCTFGYDFCVLKDVFFTYNCLLPSV